MFTSSNPARTQKSEYYKRKSEEHLATEFFQQMHSERHLLFFFFFSSVDTTFASVILPIFIAKCIGVLVQEPDQIAPGPLEGANLYTFLFLMFVIVAFIGYGLQMGYFEITGKPLRAMVLRV